MFLSLPNPSFYILRNKLSHFNQVIFSQEAIKEFEDGEPVTFVTYEFFEHELQTTPVVKGTR